MEFFSHFSPLFSFFKHEQQLFWVVKANDPCILDMVRLLVIAAGVQKLENYFYHDSVLKMSYID